MFNKHFILLLINICLCSSKLTISPCNDIEIDQGGKLEISCTALEPVDFIYPISIEPVAIRSEVKLSNEQVNGLTKFKLTRSNSVYNDSGWYGCVEKSKYKPGPHVGKIDVTPQNYNDANVKWIYVTVKSPIYKLDVMPFLLVNPDVEYVLLKKENDDVILPCRSTSSDYSVKLYSSIDNTLVDSFEYDPKKGITLKNIKKGSPLRYYCVAEKKDGTKEEIKKFKIEIIDNYSEKPVITTDKFTLMEIGKDFSMQCTSLISDYERFVLDWTVPQTDRIIKNVTTSLEIAPENEKLDYKRVTVKLTIKNVVKEDFGNYECRLYKYASVEAANINLTPHERKHLEISLNGPKTVDVIKSGASHTWTIDIDAFPLPELQWTDPQGNRIIEPLKMRLFSVNDEKFSIDYTKTKFTIDDLGIHTILAKHADMQKKVTFKVLAETSPKVLEVKQNEACLSKGATVFQCQAKGYPVPEVTWSCMDKDGLVGNGTEFKVIKEEPKEFEISSVVMVENCPQGFVVCKTHNNNGDYALTKPISKQVPAEGTDQSGSDGCPYVEKPKNNDGNSTDGNSLKKKIEVSPKIIKIEPNKKTYKLLEVVEFSCQASGNPKPVITWEFLDDRHTLIENGKKFFEVTKKTSGDTIVTSVVKVIIVLPGYVSCKAKNKLGDDNKLEKVDVEVTQTQVQQPSVQPPVASTSALVTNNQVDVTTKKAEVSGPASEKPGSVEKASSTEATKTEAKPEDGDKFSLGTEDQEVNVTKGTAVTLHCNASTSLFGVDVKWYNASNVLATGGRVEIKETKEAALHSLHLTITDMQKWDENDYSCEGTKLDGTAVRKLYHVHVNASAVFTASIILQLSIMLLAYFM
ncbi:mast/stem cell growth factor receptor Kit-like [Cotesia typhae]|uniref:mast/stem cell growth factor receptor Kit-like n=1 Tax=Cotesia typhae TaxID=2053667 RepID=UPI003D686A59